MQQWTTALTMKGNETFIFDENGDTAFIATGENHAANAQLAVDLLNAYGPAPCYATMCRDDGEAGA